MLVWVSEFQALTVDVFGEVYARSVTADLAIDALGGRTAQQALEEGVPPRDVWVALCDATEVPEARRWGQQRRRRRA